MSDLDSGKYSISPSSGRLRKRVKTKSNSQNVSIFSKRLDNFSFNSKVVFVVMLFVLIAILFIVYTKFQSDKEEAMKKYMPNQYNYETAKKK